MILGQRLPLLEYYRVTFEIIRRKGKRNRDEEYVDFPFSKIVWDGVALNGNTINGIDTLTKVDNGMKVSDEWWVSWLGFFDKSYELFNMFLKLLLLMSSGWHINQNSWL